MLALQRERCAQACLVHPVDVVGQRNLVRLAARAVVLGFAHQDRILATAQIRNEWNAIRSWTSEEATIIAGLGRSMRGSGTGT